MGRLALCALLLAAATIRAETLQADIRAGQPATIRLAGEVDDDHLTNPPGYHPAEAPAERVVERIIIENIGTETVRDPDLRLNGRPLLPVPDPIDALGVGDPSDLLAIYSAWRDRRIHGTTGLRINRDPLEVLHAFGVTFCGDDSNALGTITVARGAEVRFVWVSGHSVAEHRFPGRDWELVDGDQNLFYPRWDNRTPASGADLLADPLLALRVKLFGRHARWEPAAAWQNTSRFEFVEPGRPQKVLRLKQPSSWRSWELRRGERLEIFPGVPAEAAHGGNDGLRNDKKLRDVLCRVEFFATPTREGIVLPFPQASRAAGDPVYEVPGKMDAPLICQAARSQFPLLRVGANKLEAKAGAFRVKFQTRTVNRVAVAPPVIHAGKVFRGAPTFSVEAGGADRVWWQIAADRYFHFVPPNLDRVTEFSAVVTLDAPIDESFLSPGHEYVFRARVRRNGVWSDWSAETFFEVQKPGQPRIEGLKRSEKDAVTIRWKKDGAEMLIFGSDRLDFLPDIFDTPEPTRMENGSIRESRVAHNLLATVPGQRGEVTVPRRAAYRLIARDGKTFSVPSALGRLDGAKARVLQNRHEKPPGALVGRDVAVEMDVP